MPFRPTRKKMGFLYGLLSSCTYGMIPLFTLPLIMAGISPNTALVYRFSIATVIMWLILLFKREKIAIPFRPFLKLSGLSVFYMLSVLLFFHSFTFLPSGIVATINFLYPVMVILIMVGFFHEHPRWQIWFATFLAIAGVALLSLGPMGEPAGGSPYDPTKRIILGVITILLAALSQSIYYVGIQAARLPKIDGLVMTFYVMLISAFFSFFNAIFTGALGWITTWPEISYAFLLAIVTAVISNLTLILAIRRIGPTVTSILGVMEPLTAVAIGCLIFHEPFSSQLAGGAFLIVLAVMLVLLVPGRKHLTRKGAHIEKNT